MGATAIRPRTVLILTPSSRLLGARRSLLTLAESLDPERWQAVVCGQSAGQLGDELAERAIPMEIVPLGWWRKGKYLLWRPFALARLAALARQVQADLIHCNEIYPNPYAVRAALNVKAPEGSPCEGRPIPVVTHVRLQMKAGMIRKYDLLRADRIVVPSQSLAEEFADCPQREELVNVVPNAVNMKEFQRARTREEARRALGLPQDGVLLAAIGQVGPRKGGDVILDAFERIAAESPQARVMFVGDAHKGQEAFAAALKARAQRAPLEGRVFFLPFAQNVIPYYEASDINLLVSRQEGFGRTIIEAAAGGIPSIGTRVGGIAEIIRDGETGLLVASEDAAALAGAMGRLIVDETLRHEMADAAFRHVASHYSQSVHAGRIMDLYDLTLEKKGASL
jgi:glycosyltransferase involved in cell wall biosynthesis